ncbi:Transposase [Shigella dysenteriae 1617]|uniref:Transposase n=1 Tax=Shigella dysenteriae 1617 TaxID=754093 RepID=A0A0A6ZSR0_SHIDY|nr:Transposase [Shigella dysenteriae 1617]
MASVNIHCPRCQSAQVYRFGDGKARSTLALVRV